MWRQRRRVPIVSEGASSPCDWQGGRSHQGDPPDQGRKGAVPAHLGLLLDLLVRLHQQDHPLGDGGRPLGGQAGPVGLRQVGGELGSAARSSPTRIIYSKRYVSKEQKEGMIHGAGWAEP